MSGAIGKLFPGVNMPTMDKTYEDCIISGYTAGDNTYLATGKQEITHKGRANGSGEYAGSICTYYANGVRMNKVGAASEKKTLLEAYTTSSVQTIGKKDYRDIDLVFFQNR